MDASPESSLISGFSGLFEPSVSDSRFSEVLGFGLWRRRMGLLTYVRDLCGALFLRPNMSFEMTPGPIQALGISPCPLRLL